MCRRVRLTVRLGGSAATDARRTADEARQNREITEGIVAGMMSFRWPVTQARASVRRPHPPTAAVTAPAKPFALTQYAENAVMEKESSAPHGEEVSATDVCRSANWQEASSKPQSETARLDQETRRRELSCGPA